MSDQPDLTHPLEPDPVPTPKGLRDRRRPKARRKLAAAAPGKASPAVAAP